MILTVLLLSFMTTAQQPSPPAANDLGVIKGTVVDPDGKPVEGARVYAAGDNDPPMLRPDTTTTNANGDFVIDHVHPRKVKIHAYKDSDYYKDIQFAFDLPPKLEMPEVEVKPGQTVTGVTVRLMQKAGKLHLNVRDADTIEPIIGIGYLFCREDHPTEGGYCIGGGGLSDREHFMPVGVGISIKIEADDGQHEKWEYRDPKTGSPYFRAKSGETEIMNIYLRKKK
jgi:Carboxypeptidase regulatory-like domain